MNARPIAATIAAKHITSPALPLLIWALAAGSGCGHADQRPTPVPPSAGAFIREKQVGENHCRGPELEGKPHGLWTCTRPSGAVFSRIHYRHGLRHGTGELFFEDGNPDTVTGWENGVLHGPFRSYHRQGGLHVRATYVQAVLDGELTEWDEHGRLVARTHYRQGAPHGPSMEWHANGALKSHAVLNNGALHGPRTEWRADGSLRRRVFFRDGLPLTPVEGVDIDIRERPLPRAE